MNVPPEGTTEEDSSTGRIYFRLQSYMAAVALLAAAIIGWNWGWHLVVAFAVGSCAAGVNWFWLKRAIERAMAPALLAEGRKPTGRIVVFFMFRYLFIGAAAYVIFESSSTLFYGFFAGLLLPAAAIVCEAAYEAYGTLRGASV